MVCVKFYEYDLPHINTTAGNDLLYCQKTCWTLGERIIEKICFRFWSRNFQCCTPDVYLKFVFSVLNVVTVSYLRSLLFKGAASC